MPEPLVPPEPPSQPTMDGLSHPAAPEATVPAPTTPVPSLSPEKIKKTERSLLVFGGGIYVLYALWCAGLMALVPGPDAVFQSFVSIALLSVLVGGVLCLLVGWVVLMRISKSPVSIAQRQRSLIKAVIVLTPAILLSAAVPLMVTRQPSLGIDITSPASAADLVAPVSVTLSVQKAAEILRKRGLHPVKYQWDINADGKIDSETAVPITTTLFDHQGVYTPVMHIVFDNGSYQRVATRIIIPQAVFTITPAIPVLQKPTSFSVAQLLTDPKQLDTVTWDFGDGTPSETTKTADDVHTYYAVGQYTVSLVIQLLNKTQVPLKKVISVQLPLPLPFPVALTTEPQNLLGSAPFGTIFQVQTDTPLKEIQWTFGDGKTERGADLTRIGHSFENPGVYAVLTDVRSASGQLAELTTIVKVTTPLSLSDLHFEGSPDVQSNKVLGEVPLTLALTPRTSVPLVHFLWEAPDATSANIQGETLHAVYRKEGTYTLTLVGQDADGKVLRQPITVVVQPPAAEPAISVDPDGGVAPLAATFDASSTFVPPGETLAGFKWLFGDEMQGGGKAELGAASVQHTYQTPGDYTVSLTAVMVSGKEYTAERTIVVRKPSLSACLTTSRVTVQAGGGVQFDSSCSTGLPSSYLWDVRSDSQTGNALAQSTTPSYVYVFDTVGSYTVTLTIKDQFGDQDKKSISITVTP